MMYSNNYSSIFCKKFNLPPSVFEMIHDSIEFISYSEDTIVISPGEKNQYLYFIVEGFGTVYGVTDSGSIRNLYLQRESRIITSLSSILDHAPAKYYFEIFADSVVAKLSIQNLEELSKRSIDICLWYNHLLKECVSIMTFRLEGLLLKTAKERLLEMYEKDPELFSQSLKKHLAGVLGITPNSLSRILSAKAK